MSQFLYKYLKRLSLAFLVLSIAACGADQSAHQAAPTQTDNDTEKKAQNGTAAQEDNEPTQKSDASLEDKNASDGNTTGSQAHGSDGEDAQGQGETEQKPSELPEVKWYEEFSEIQQKFGLGDTVDNVVLTFVERDYSKLRLVLFGQAGLYTSYAELHANIEHCESESYNALVIMSIEKSAQRPAIAMTVAGEKVVTLRISPYKSAEFQTQYVQKVAPNAKKPDYVDLLRAMYDCGEKIMGAQDRWLLEQALKNSQDLE